ncbi:MAG: QcrA and Rieske domain-containing protein [Nitrososphaerales archaeon]
MPDTQARKDARKINSVTRNEALSALARIQRYIAITFIASALLGIFLLATDHSLWLLASSHAYGLAIIVVADLVLGILNYLSVRQVYLGSIAWGVLTFLLQVGDILTAPQYKMTMVYFATYLFSLWAFDALLLAQITIVALGLFGRSYLQYKTHKKVTYFDMVSKDSRRDFLQISGSIAVLVAIAGVFGLADAFGGSAQNTPQNTPQNTTTSNLPSGAVANIKDLTEYSPVYFEYPSGYPNVLFKKADGTVTALSMLCTHVCCQLNFQGNGELFCPCHGSYFDDTGKVLGGPAPLPLPSVELTIDAEGNVFPKSVKGSSPCYQG